MMPPVGLGEQLALPFVIGPTGLNGAFSPEGDLCVARAAEAADVPFVMSTAATSRLDPVAAASGPLRWFQLYLFKERAMTAALLDRVRACGFTVPQVTVDMAVAGRRNRDIRNGFSLPFRWSVRNFVDMALHPHWALQMLKAGTPALRRFAEFAGQPGKEGTIAQVLRQPPGAPSRWRRPYDTGA